MGEKFPIVVGETGVGEQIGAVGEGFSKGGLTAPAADGGMVAAGEDFGDGDAAEVGRASVVRVVQKTSSAVGGAGNAVRGVIGRVCVVAEAEALVEGGVFMAKDAREQADGGVDDDGCAEFAAGENEVADGQLVVAEELGDTFVDAFVTAADKDDTFERGEAARGGLRETLALRGEKDHGLACSVACGFGGDAERLDALKDGLRLEDHALATAEGAVVNGAMAVVGPVAEVMGVDRRKAGAQRALEDAVAERALEEAGKEGDEVEAHA